MCNLDLLLNSVVVSSCLWYQIHAALSTEGEAVSLRHRLSSAAFLGLPQESKEQTGLIMQFVQKHFVGSEVFVSRLNMIASFV